MLNASDRSIYWIEADEEAAIFASKGKTLSAKRSLIAYVLLGHRIIAHPADFWQSRHTNELVFNVQAQPLLKDLMFLQVGSSENVEDYISNRIEKLRTDNASSKNNVEYEQYQRYGHRLLPQASELDDLMTRIGRTYPTEGSRDARFRSLVLSDVNGDIMCNWQIGACLRYQKAYKDAELAIRLITNLLRDRRRFVSIDGILARLKDFNYPQEIISRIHTRLQVLHWEARINGGLSIPLLARANSTALDPSDPDVFWTALGTIVGKDFEEDMLRMPWQISLLIATELRNDSCWKKFVSVYFEMVAISQDENAGISEASIEAFAKQKYPGFLNCVVKKRPDNWTLLSWVFHMGSWAVGIPTGVSLALRVGSGLCAVKKAYDHTVKIVGAYHSTDRHIVRSRIRQVIAEAKGPI